MIDKRRPTLSERTAYGFDFYMSKSNFSKSLFDSEEGQIGAFLIKQLVSS